MAKKQKDAAELRFAAMVRVSGEAQAKHGESLRTQHEQITNAVDGLGATVSKWYEGQEHATPGHERKLLDAMLRDAAAKRKPFDALVVADPTRWSRDNEKSDSALDHLRDNGIRFFVLGQEFNLYDPVHRFMLQQFASFSELSAALNLQKAMDNRIARAKRNCPTNGSLPWGRTFDKQTETWGIDPAKQEIMQDIAERYIGGEGLKALAAEYGLEHTGLHVRLMEKCGPVWPIRFNSPRLNIDETVDLKIPALLDAKTIRAVQRRCKLNKTTTHGTKTSKYLLSRMVFCAGCGGSLSGWAGNRRGQRQYRHFGHNCLHGCVQADELEETVLLQLFECFGNPVALERAVAAATPTMADAAKNQKRLKRLAGELAKITAGRDRVLSVLARGTVTEAQAEKQLLEMGKREQKLQDQFDQLTQHMDNAPTAEQLQRVTDAVQDRFGRKRVSAKGRAIRSGITYKDMTWDEKRALVELVFSGTDEAGQRLGVHIEPYNGPRTNSPKRWAFRIKGHLIDAEGLTLNADLHDAMSEDAEPGKQTLKVVSSLGRTCRVR